MSTDIRYFESLKLNQFFSRLLSEGLHYKVDRITFVLSHEALVVSLARWGNSLKVIEISKDWIQKITTWMSSVCSKDVNVASRMFLRRSLEVINCDVLVTETGWEIRNLSTQPLSVSLSELGFKEEDWNLIESGLKKEAGLICYVINKDEPIEIVKQLAGVVSATEVFEITEAASIDNREGVLRSGVLIGIVRAETIPEAMKSLLAKQVRLDQASIIGVVHKEGENLVWRSPLGSHARSEAHKTEHGRTVQSENISPPHKRVLLVEDDHDQREIVSMMLRAEGYEVECANNGLEGLEAAKRVKPSVIVTDLMMPVLDGTQFIKRLKSEPELAAIPVMVLTVLDDETHELELLRIGARDYCSKNMQPKVLCARIGNLLK